MTIVELYSKEDCHLCEEAKKVLERVREEIPFALREVKLSPGDEYFEEYKELVPVVHINRRFAFKYRVSEHQLKIKLRQETEERNPDVDPGGPEMERRT